MTEDKEIQEIIDKISLFKMTVLSKKVGVNTNHLQKAVRGYVPITHKLAYEISEATNGFLSMEEILKFSNHAMSNLKKEKGKDNG